MKESGKDKVVRRDPPNVNHPTTTPPGEVVKIKLSDIETDPVGDMLTHSDNIRVGGPHLRGVYLSGSESLTEKQLGVRHFSRFSRSGPVQLSTPERFPLLCRGRSDLHFQDFPPVHSHQTGFAESIGAETAPGPKLRGRHQSSRYWVAMNVAQFFDAFVFGPDVEVVEALLPDMLREAVKNGSLRGIAPSLLRQDASRKSKFESLHYGRRSLHLRLADQQVNVLGHDHVTYDHERVASAHLLQDSQQQITTAGGPKQRLPPITTAGDEV